MAAFCRGGSEAWARVTTWPVAQLGAVDPSRPPHLACPVPPVHGGSTQCGGSSQGKVGCPGHYTRAASSQQGDQGSVLPAWPVPFPQPAGFRDSVPPAGSGSILSPQQPGTATEPFPLPASPRNFALKAVLCPFFFFKCVFNQFYNKIQIEFL
jgi:hypothetical protein